MMIAYVIGLLIGFFVGAAVATDVAQGTLDRYLALVRVVLILGGYGLAWGLTR